MRILKFNESKLEIYCQDQLEYLGIDAQDLDNILQDLLDDFPYQNDNVICNGIFLGKWNDGTPAEKDKFQIHFYHHGKGEDIYKKLKDGKYFDEINSRLSDYGLEISSIKKHIDNWGGKDSFHMIIGKLRPGPMREITEEGSTHRGIKSK